MPMQFHHTAEDLGLTRGEWLAWCTSVADAANLDDADLLVWYHAATHMDKLATPEDWDVLMRRLDKLREPDPGRVPPARPRVGEFS